MISPGQVFLANPNFYVVLDVHRHSTTGFYAVIDMNKRTYYAKWINVSETVYIEDEVQVNEDGVIRCDSMDELEFWCEI